MHKSVTKYVKKCQVCQRNKIGVNKTYPPLTSIHVGDPFEKLGIDIIGKLPTSAGKQYIIVATDYFTRWVETRALSHKTASITARFLIENILCKHGCPKTILSDQGTNFTSAIIAELEKFMSSK